MRYQNWGIQGEKQPQETVSDLEKNNLPAVRAISPCIYPNQTNNRYDILSDPKYLALFWDL